MATTSSESPRSTVGDGMAECRFCDYTTATGSGLSLHIKLSHPDEANKLTESGAIGGNHKRWTDDERNVLALLEIEALRQGHMGTVDVSRYMAKHHMGRTLEGIKAERRKPAYQNAYQLQMRLKAGALSGHVELPVNMSTSRTLNIMAGATRNETRASLTSSGASTTGNASKVEVVFERNRDQSHSSSEFTIRNELKREIEQGIEYLGNKRKYRAPLLIEAAKAVLLDPCDIDPTMKWLAEITVPKQTVRRTSRKNSIKNVTKKSINKRSQDRMEYAKLQTLYKRSPKRAAKYILEGNKNVSCGPKEAVMFEFWNKIFSTDQSAQNDNANDTLDTNHLSQQSVLAICGPVQPSELLLSKPRRGTAEGPDGLTATRWRVLPEEWKTLFYNILLYAKRLPSELVTARTIFIAKVDGPCHPSEYRPISITSVVLRQFHSILARRLQHALAHDERQRAFQRSVDGSAENVLLLNAILKDARDNKKELHLISLDLNKAFDSVHHTSILSTLKRKGCPTQFIDHMERVYSEASTVLQYNGQEHATQVNRGVLQGDPLSPGLFNYVIDEALASLNSSLGYLLGNQRISAIAFADDIILLSGSAQGLQINLKAMTTALKSSGLTINRNKTTALSFVSVTHRKVRRMAVKTTELFEHEGLPIRQLGPSTKWKYLGTWFEGMYGCENVSEYLGVDVRKISKAKLKPQQKLMLLKRHVLPKYTHALVLGKASQVTLSTVDKDIRKFTRWWLRFPRDVPTSYLHGTCKLGGLGVSSLSIEIPRMRLNRIQRFIDRDSAMSRAFGSSGFAKKLIKVCKARLEKVGLVDTSKISRDEYWRSQLGSKIDTSGLNPGDPVSHKWLDHTGKMTGGDFVKFNHLRAGCLPTAARLARGRDTDARCRWGCNSSETNYHVIQQCKSSEGGRRLRHNAVVKFMASVLDKNSTVHKEPKFQTISGTNIPDLIVVTNGTAWVMDVQIVKDDNMAQYHLNKRQKYKTCSGLNDLIMRRYGCSRVKHRPITVSYKGIIHQETANTLRNRFGLSESSLAKVTLLILRGSYSNWASLKARTWKVTRRNPSFVAPT